MKTKKKIKMVTDHLIKELKEIPNQNYYAIVRVSNKNEWDGYITCPGDFNNHSYFSTSGENIAFKDIANQYRIYREFADTDIDWIISCTCNENFKK